MYAEIFALCEKASSDKDRLTIVGTFSGTDSYTVPLQIQPFYVAARVRYENVEQGEHAWRITIVDAKDRQINKPFGDTINIKMSSETPFAWQTITARFEGVVFKAFGEHTVRLEINEKLISSVPFIIHRIGERSGIA
jgi:uncharacterized protein DUF6941